MFAVCNSRITVFLEELVCFIIEVALGCLSKKLEFLSFMVPKTREIRGWLMIWILSVMFEEDRYSERFWF